MSSLSSVSSVIANLERTATNRKQFKAPSLDSATTAKISDQFVYAGSHRRRKRYINIFKLNCLLIISVLKLRRKDEENSIESWRNFLIQITVFLHFIKKCVRQMFLISGEKRSTHMLYKYIREREFLIVY